MRTNTLSVTLASALMFCFCAVVAQDDAKAEKDIETGAFAIRHAKVDSSADFHQFRRDAQVTINENKTKIAGLKKREAKQVKSSRAEYKDNVLALEKRNNDMTSRYNSADRTRTSNWTTFKRDFDEDMSALVASIRSMESSAQ